MIERIIYNQKMYTVIDIISIYHNVYLIIRHQNEIRFVEKVIENSVPLYLLPPTDLTIEHNVGMPFHKLKHYHILTWFTNFLEKQPEQKQTSFFEKFQVFLKEEITTYVEPSKITLDDVQNFDATLEKIKEKFFEQIEYNSSSKNVLEETEEYVLDPSYQPYYPSTKIEKSTFSKMIVEPMNVPTLIVEAPILDNTKEVKETKKRFTFQGMIQAFTLVMITVSISLGSLFYILISV